MTGTAQAAEESLLTDGMHSVMVRSEREVKCPSVWQTYSKRLYFGAFSACGDISRLQKIIMKGKKL